MRTGMIEAMKQRHSVRNYQDKELPVDLIRKITDYLEHLEVPDDVKIKLVKQGFGGKGVKLGTYGVIKGASCFLVGACTDSREGRQALGLTMEKVVLFCTSLGLGTCWMGGTFRKGNFAKVIQLEDNEVIAIVSPVGWEAEKNSLIGSIMSQKGKRNEFDKMFFLNDFSTPLGRKEAGEFEVVLEMVRIAPSALNRQPWRIVKVERKFHFYLDGTAVMQQVDMGIAMCHFSEAALECGLKGTFRKENPGIETKYEYIGSWIEE